MLYTLAERAKDLSARLRILDNLAEVQKRASIKIRSAQARKAVA